MAERGTVGARGPWILALDVGTSSARSLLFDRTGAPLQDAPVLQLPNAWRITPDGGMEADAEALLINTLACVQAAVELARALRLELAGIAIASFWHSVLGVSAAGEPLTPVFGWGDTRAATAADRLAARLDPVAYHRRTGCFLDPSYPAARLLWLRDSYPDIFRRTAHWLSFGEYLGLRLTGEPTCSISMASATGLFDTRRLAWDEEVLAAVGVAPPSLSPLEPADGGRLLPVQVERWPEFSGVPCFAALGDGACASFGAGAVGPRLRGLTIGTSAALRVLTAADPVEHEALWCYRLDERRVVVGRALSNGGNGIDALLGWLSLPPPAEREAELAAMGPDVHGLTVLPFLLGERGPAGRPPQGGTLAGLTGATRPIEILRAWMEAVALRLAEPAAQLDAAYGAPERVIAGGGAVHRSSSWRQLVADVLGRPVALSATAETAARGAALVALERIRLIADGSAAPLPEGELTLPDPERHGRYQLALARQSALERTLHPLARAVQPS